MKKIFILTGEPSGDKLASKVISKLQENRSDIKFLRGNKILTLPKDSFEEFDIRNTGDKHQYKVCDRCFKRLDTNLFSNNRIKKHGITKRPSCKSCRRVKEGKDISVVDRKKWDLKKPKDFNPFTCPICNKTTIAGISKIVLDHNHQTGEVRGYLCESCNTGIGRFDDNLDLLDILLRWQSLKALLWQSLQYLHLCQTMKQCQSV